MKKAVKIVGAILGFLMLAIVVLLLAAQVKYSSMAEQRHETPSLELRVTKQPGWPAEGERIARLKGCSDCHGRDMGGQIFIEDPAMGTYAGTNLTSGKGGIGQQYTDKDWVRAIRYGLSRDGKYLRFMPSQEFHALTDEDLGKLIAYLKTLPPVDRTAPAVQVGPKAKVLSMMNQMPLLFSGSHIDHSQRTAKLASRRRHQQKKQCWEMELRSIQKNSDHRNNTGRQSFESAVHTVESHCGDV